MQRCCHPRLVVRKEPGPELSGERRNGTIELGQVGRVGVRHGGSGGGGHHEQLCRHADRLGRAASLLQDSGVSLSAATAARYARRHQPDDAPIAVCSPTVGAEPVLLASATNTICAMHLGAVLEGTKSHTSVFVTPCTL
jgi:hypothetical protein